MNNQEPTVHIIIPFVSTNAYVQESIENILKLDYKNYLLLLVSDEKTSLNELFKKNDQIKFLTSGNKNISFKRNLALTKYPDADYFAFIDSDAYPETQWLSRAIESFKSDETWAVGGPNIPPPTEPLCKRIVGNASQSFLLTGKNSFRKRISHSRFCLDLPTCNLIVSKHCLKSLKGFDENLYTGEDIEFCQRIVKEGKKIYYSKDVIVYHHNRSFMIPFLNQRIVWGMSSTNILRKSPSFSKIYLLFPFFLLIGILASPLILFFSTSDWLFIIFFAYIAAVLYESILWSKKIIEFPGTFFAILLGNISPGIGTLLSLIYSSKNKEGIETLKKKMYRNF